MKRYIALLVIVVLYLWVIMGVQEGMVESSTTTVKLLYTMSDWTDATESITTFLSDIDNTRFLLFLPFNPDRDTDEIITSVNNLGVESDPKMILIYSPPLLDAVKTELFEFLVVDSAPDTFVQGLFTLEAGSEAPTETDYVLTDFLASSVDEPEGDGGNKKKGIAEKAANKTKKGAEKAWKDTKKAFGGGKKKKKNK
jgi:hypothetical protein